MIGCQCISGNHIIIILGMDHYKTYGGRAKYKKIKFVQGKIRWKKILARQLILKKYSYYDLKRIHSRNLIAKKIPAARKFPFTSNPTPPPPITFLIVRPLANSVYRLSIIDFYRLILAVLNFHHPLWRQVVLVAEGHPMAFFLEISVRSSLECFNNWVLIPHERLSISSMFRGGFLLASDGFGFCNFFVELRLSSLLIV